LDRLQQAFEFCRVTFLVDRDASARIDVPIPRTPYVLFVENVTAEEILLVLKEMGMSGEPSPKSRGRGPADFDTASVRTLTSADCLQFAKILGLESSSIERHMSGQSAATARQSTAEGKGSGPQETDTARKESADPVAIVVADPDSNLQPRPMSRPLSPQIKRFFESGRARRDGGISALIYVRVANGR
jgi:hypothetical protein